MSKYIDIVKIMKEKKKFNIKIESNVSQWHMDGSLSSYSALITGECLVFDNGVCFHHNGNAKFIYFNEKESREDKAKKFTNRLCDTPVMAHLLQHHVEDVKVSIDRDVFWLSNRDWRG